MDTQIRSFLRWTWRHLVVAVVILVVLFCLPFVTRTSGSPLGPDVLTAGQTTVILNVSHLLAAETEPQLFIPAVSR